MNERARCRRDSPFGPHSARLNPLAGVASPLDYCGETGQVFGMEPRLTLGFAASLAALAVLPTASLATGTGAAPVPCEMLAYLANDDAAGTNVRSGPGKRAPIILHVGGDQEAVATVTGFHEGWFRVEKLEQVGTDDDRVLLEGRQGWIHRTGLHVDVAAADANLRRRPQQSSQIVRQLQGEHEGVVLLGCSGKWARVGVGTDKGWLSPAGQCANPLTTCN